MVLLNINCLPVPCFCLLPAPSFTAPTWSFSARNSRPFLARWVTYLLASVRRADVYAPENFSSLLTNVAKELFWMFRISTCRCCLPWSLRKLRQTAAPKNSSFGSRGSISGSTRCKDEDCKYSNIADKLSLREQQLINYTDFASIVRVRNCNTGQVSTKDSPYEWEDPRRGSSWHPPHRRRTQEKQEKADKGWYGGHDDQDDCQCHL